MTDEGSDVVLCMVSDTFADSVRRGFYSTADQTILSLVESDEIRRVLVVDHPRGVLSQVRRRLVGDVPARRSGKLRGVRPLTLATEFRANERSLARRYGAYDAQLALAARRHRLRDPYLITFDLMHAAFGRADWSSGQMFYAQDDESEIPRLAFRRELTRQAYRRVAEGGATVAAVTSELMRRIVPGGSGMVVPNGVDPELWRFVHPDPLASENQQRPVAAYAGTVDSRLDVDAFARLAQEGFRVLIAGPVRDARLGEVLSGVDNVMLLGNLSRSRVVSLLGHADVCILAHVSTRLTEAMSPLKFFEYVASGTPLVATDLCGTREAAPAGANIVLVPPGGDYVPAARAAVEAGRLSEQQRRVLVGAMSWRARHQPVIHRVVTGAVSGITESLTSDRTEEG